MNMTNTIAFVLETNPSRITRMFAAGFVLAMGATRGATIDSPQRTFTTPLEVIQATIAAAEHNDTAALLKLFGPMGKDIVESGDPVEDKEMRAEFARSAHEKLQVEEDAYNPNRVMFTVGTQEWPFPVPLVRQNGTWHLDSASGKLELLARRVGRNELNAMDVCRGYAEAQMDYASTPRDADRVLKYAERVASSPGKQDGLYTDGATTSLVSRNFAEAAQTGPPAPGKKREPYHGYYFRILKSQGPDADGGIFDYLVNGKMIGGFALLAWPAEYGVSGIQTFIINHGGVVYGKDLGPTTPAQTRQITRFNPDKSWHPMILE
jgi:hypothetical protein